MRHFCAQADPKAHATRLRRRGLPVPGAALPSAYCIQPTTLLSAYSVQPAARYACSPRPGAQAPSDSIPPYASHPPFATHRASLHAWFLTQLHAMRPSSAQFSAQCPKRLLPRPQYPRRSQHPAHHASRHLRHPTHRAPIACGIRPTMPPGACSIRPTAPKRLQPSPKHPRLPSHCTPDSPSLPHNASLGSLAWAPLAYHVSSPNTPTTCSVSNTRAKRP